MTNHITDMDTLSEEDFGDVEWDDTVTAAKIDPTDPVDGESLRPKFDSVAAFKLHRWSLDGGHDEETGNAVDWHRWSALFRNVTQSDSPNKSEQPAAILVTDSQGFVTASWYPDGVGAEEVWESLEKEWAEFDDTEEDEV